MHRRKPAVVSDAKTGGKEKGDDTDHGDSSTNEKRQILKRRFVELAKQAKGVKGISDDDIISVFLGGTPKYEVGPNVEHSGSISLQPSKGTNKFKRPIFVVLAVLVALPIFIGTISCLAELEFSPSNILKGIKNLRCVIENNGIVMEAARPIVDCAMCKDLRAVPIEVNLTQQEFIKKYAYSAVPVLVKEATINWTAMSQFSFSFFKDLYTSKPDALASVEDECQFFPYNTDFATLEEVFNMSEARATFQPEQDKWYVGWSNCHQETANELRKYYSKPYFLPNDSESSALDWVFMGGSGEGANLHLDYVQRPSWQAQIQGRKTWELVPSPECETTCHSMNVTVEKGDIFVIDTNTWYHSTFIHPGEISITIGSEYD